MSTLAGSNGLVTGVVPPNSNKVNELQEYEKILKLRDQIFAGNHPRLTVPSNVIRKVSPHLTRPLSPTQTSVPPETTSQPSKIILPGLNLSNNPEIPQQYLSMPNGIPINLRPNLSTPAVSEIDPIFLTKADVLVRAEIQNHRQRIERNLRDQLERKRNNARHKPSLQEAKPDFDVSDVLSRALEIVKPVTFEDSQGANENASASDSFDENSFYSSKAPDSTPQDRPSSPPPKHLTQHVDVEDLDADENVDPRADEVRPVNLSDSPYKINPRPNFLLAPQSHLSQGTNRNRPHPQHRGSDLTSTHLDEDDEPEYSPPEPAEDFQDRNSSHQYSRRQAAENGRRTNGRYSGQFQGGRRFDSPSESEAKTIRRGQPSYYQRQAGGHDLQTSPDVSMQTVQPRKKRKVDNKKNSRKRATSPEVMIKDEPVSPPPFHQVQPLGSRSRPIVADRPIYIDVEPPREVRYLPATEKSIVYDLEPPAPRSEPRAYSRPGVPDVEMANRDIRKVTSLQQMRSEPRHEVVEPVYQTPTRFSRAPSHTMIEGESHSSQLRAYQDSTQAYERPIIRKERIVQPPAYRESDHEYETQQMALPQRRIVVDQHGNQFYEISQPRTTAIPSSMRQVDVDSYNELASVRNGVVRAPSVIREPYREERYVQDMPPPQLSYRRVTEIPRNAIPEPRSLPEEQYDTRKIQRSASVQVIDYPSRQPVYVDSRAPTREVLRMSSVRPNLNRYEEASDVIQRVQSVRPEGREMSTFLNDRPQVRREYVQVERPTYEVRRTVRDDGYYEVEEGGGMMLDGATARRQYFTQQY